MRVILIGLSRDIEFDLRNDLFSHIVTLSQDFYAKYRTGDIMARATNDLNAVRMMLGPGIMYFTETFFTAVFLIGVMWRVDWRLTLFCLIPAPLVSAAVILFGRRIHDRFETIQKMFSDISSRVQENLSGVRVIRAYAQEEAEIRKFELLNQDYVAQNIGLARLSALFMPLLQALIGIGFLIVLLAGGYQLLAHRISLGSFVMFNTYMGMLIWPMIALGWVVNLMQRGTASWSRIMELMHEKPSIHRREMPAHTRNTTEVRGALRFDGVEMKYPAGYALKNITLEIPAGATVAIVGPHRQRQEHAGESDPALDGSHARRCVSRWHRLARFRSGMAAPPDRIRSAGDVPVQRHAGREHRLGRGRRDRRRHRARRGIGGARARHRKLPGRLRHHHRRARHHAIRRPEAARRHRARHPARSEDPDPGRRARERRHPHRRAHSRKASKVSCAAAPPF